MIDPFVAPYPSIPSSLSPEEHNRRVRANTRAWDLWCDRQLPDPTDPLGEDHPTAEERRRAILRTR
jgi:hypothetical protein